MTIEENVKRMHTPLTPRGRVYRVVFMIVLGLAVLAGMFLWNVDDARSAPAQQQVVQVQADDTDARYPVVHIDPKVWMNKFAYKYRHHRLDNSQDRWIPRKFIRALRHWKHRHPAKRPLYHRVLDYGECMFNSIGTPLATPWQAMCLVYGESPSFRTINRHVFKWRVVCSSAAIFGWTGKGIKGAVFGSGACAAKAAFDLYNEWRDNSRPMHPTSRAD